MDPTMIAKDTPTGVFEQSGRLPEFIQSKARDTVIVFRPCLGTILDLVRSAPHDLALLCVHDSLPELRHLSERMEADAAARSIIFFHGGLHQSLRVFPLRWRLALIEGAAEAISAPGFWGPCRPPGSDGGFGVR